MSNAEKSVDDVRRIERLLKAETGLRVIASSDAEVRSKLQCLSPMEVFICG